MRRAFAFAAGLIATGALAPSSHAEDITIRVSAAAAQTHPATRHIELFKAAVEDKTDGVEVQTFPNRQLGGDKETLEGVRAGSIDCATNSSVLYPLVVNKTAFDAMQLPFLVSNYDDQSQMYQSDVAQQMLDSLNDVGLKGLSYSEGGFRHFLNRGGFVTTLDDFQGLKTRIVPVPLHKGTWEAVGANPVGVAYGEVYTSLQTGVIDAVEFNLSSISGENVYEIAKYVTLTGHYFWPQVLSCNLETFNSWPENVQRAVVDAGQEIIGPVVDYAKQQDQDLRGELQEKGVKIRDFEEIEAMREAVAPILDEWADKHPLIEAYIEEARALRKTD